MPLEQVIGANLEALFPGVEILGWYTFRITRNTDLQIDNGDEAEDLLSLIQEEVRNRRFAEVVRIEVHASMPASLRQLLLDGVQRAAGAAGAAAHRATTCTRSPGLLDTADLLTLASLDIPGAAGTRSSIRSRRRGSPAPRNIFDVIREGDILLHHPYDSFADLGRAVHPDRRGGSRTCSPSSSRSTAPAATRASRGCWRRRPSGASRWRC